MNRIVYLHGFASGPSSKKALYFRNRLGGMVIPTLDAGDFERLTITGQLAIIDHAAAGEPVSLIGSSLGGYLAALYAARHKEVTRVVLLAPAFCFARRWEDRLGPAQIADWRRTGTLDVFHYGSNSNRQLGVELLDDAARYEDYPDFRQPCLIFHGAHDDVVPPAYSETFAATHPNVTLEILDSGHELLNVFDHMGAKVEEFLRATVE